MTTTRRSLLALLAGLMAVPVAVRAETVNAAAAADPQDVVVAFRDGLAAITALGLDLAPRSEQVQALGDRVLAIERIAGAAVGSARMAAWPPEDRSAVVEAFRRYTAVVLAGRLNDIEFAAMQIGATRGGPGGGMVVEARLHDDTMQFLVVPEGDDWRILDVVRAGISELALRRSEFAAAAETGAEALAARLGTRTEALLNGES